MAVVFTAEKLFYSPREVAEILNYKSLTTVYELVKGEFLQAHNRKPGTAGLKITGASLEKYINGNMVKPEHFQE
ncbi:helix-turn-helix domain-containing protein [Desulfuromonas acetoxidans]|uniref:helix-turn-helix domain-containing protein n=1 Tax=Desulfuromonas acetoxidans TaxID=891 RepID=UPI00293052BF|nr:helix-turn-helix domain-containing protein [Desulfuromonas acetoxidans]